MSFSNYVNVTTFTPGERADGRNESIPDSIMVGVPYRITHQFDVPLNINLCTLILLPFDEDIDNPYYTTHLYTRESSGFVEDSDGIHCELVSLEKETEGYIYSKINGTIEGSTYSYVYLDTNPALNVRDMSSVRQYVGFNTTPSRSNVLGSSYKPLIVNYHEPLGNRTFYLRAYGSNNQTYFEAQRNTSYNKSITFTNDYAYPIFDLPFIIRASVVDSSERLIETNLVRLSGELEGYIEMIGARNSSQGNISVGTDFIINTKTEVGVGGIHTIFISSGISRGSIGYEII